MVRCHQDSQELRDFQNFLQAATGEKVYLVWDTVNGAPMPAGRNGIPITRTVLEDLGLHDHPREFGWLCGDYCYYVGRAALPDYDRYCLIENDIHVGEQTLRDFFELVKTSPACAGAARLREYDETPKFSAGLKKVGRAENVGCIFPLTFADADIVDDMRALRREISTKDSSLQINDEAVLASAALASGRSVLNLYDLANLVPAERFTTNPPKLREGIKPDPSTPFIHPALSFATTLDRAARGGRLFRLRRMRMGQSGAHVSAAVARAVDGSKRLASENHIVPEKRLNRTASLLLHLPDFQKPSMVQTSTTVKSLDDGARNLIALGQISFTGLVDASADLEELNKQAGSNETFAPWDGSGSHVPAGVDYCRMSKQAGTQLSTFGRAPVADLPRVVSVPVAMDPSNQTATPFWDIVPQMMELGFRFLRFRAQEPAPINERNRARLKRAHFGTIYEARAVFGRDLDRLDELDATALSKLAVVADGVLDDPDLTLACLETLVSQNRTDQDAIAAYLSALPPNMRRPKA